MNLIKWSEEKIQKMKYWDMALVKFVCILFGLILGAYFYQFIRQHILIFWVLFLAGYITGIYRFFIKR